MATEFRQQEILDKKTAYCEKADYLSHFFLLRRTAYENAGGVDGTIGSTGPDDFDLIWTLLERGGTVATVPDLLYNYRDHDQERLSLADPAVQIRNLQKIYNKHNFHGKERQLQIEQHAGFYGVPLMEHLGEDSVAVFFRSNLRPQTRRHQKLYLTPGDLDTAIGTIQDGKMICDAAIHSAGHCIFGPGLVTKFRERIRVRYYFADCQPVSAGSPGSQAVVSIDIYDRDSEKIESILHLSEQNMADSHGAFDLSFESQSRHAYEFRVYWHGISTMTFVGIQLKAFSSQFDPDYPGCEPLSNRLNFGVCKRPVYDCFYIAGSDFQKHCDAGVRASAYIDYYAIAMDKCYPDTLLQLNRAGIEEAMVAKASFKQVNIYAADTKLLSQLCYENPPVYWHHQQMGLEGLIGSAGLYFPGEGQAVVTLLQSDLVQRFLLSPGNAVFRNQIESSFSQWYKLMFNAVMDVCEREGFDTLYSPTSEQVIERTNKEIDVRLFKRIYDYPSRQYSVQSVSVDKRSYWKIPLKINAGRRASLSARIMSFKPRRRICLLHDIEGNVDTDISLAECNQNLRRMLEIEQSLGIQGTYHILGRRLEELLPVILSHGKHAIGFHSYNHQVDELDQLRKCREISWEFRGYRPPQSKLTPELSDYNLALNNFEWLASSTSSLGFANSRLENGLAKIPIAIDDYGLHTGATNYAKWKAHIIQEAGRNDIFCFSVHDCYASGWIDDYVVFLKELQGMGELITCEQLAGEMFRGSSNSYELSGR